MCTVTFIPTSYDNFVLTSNRDEAPGRSTLIPYQYDVNGVKLLFPKDELAGGTWIGISEKKRLICLLNGGFIAHERQVSYKMSRGIIVKDLLTSEILRTEINAYDFTAIEPFTIVAVDWSAGVKIYELVWDGAKAHFSEKPLVPHIWSSSLLYTSEIKKQRESWFSKFLFEELHPSPEKILDFHKTAGTGNIVNDMIMNRGFVKTKSITQVQMDNKKVSMRYEDLTTQTTTNNSL